MKFYNFAGGVLLGLARAFTTDVDVFLLGLVGLCLGAPVRLLRGIGLALLFYVGLRRADQYVGVVLSRSLRDNGQ